MRGWRSALFVQEVDDDDDDDGGDSHTCKSVTVVMRFTTDHTQKSISHTAEDDKGKKTHKFDTVIFFFCSFFPSFFFVAMDPETFCHLSDPNLGDFP